MVSDLAKKWYIKIEIEKEKGNARKIFIGEIKKLKRTITTAKPIGENANTPIGENANIIIQDNNNTRINKKSSYEDLSKAWKKFEKKIFEKKNFGF
jgi:hypothetical protein